MSADARKGLIFDIQGFSVHDGPGCRTLVFLSGCPLGCFWCSNPEGMTPKPVLMHFRSRCACTDQRCRRSCPRGAISSASSDEGKPEFDRSLCSSCTTFECARGCYHEALVVCGRYYSVRDLLKVLERDSRFWGEGGGVTFGGGEPLAQPDFLYSVLQACQRAHIHTAVETSAYVDPGRFSQVMGLVDWAFVDIKHMDPARHREGTGVDNRLILENIASLKPSGWAGRLVVRIPVVPGFNDSEDNLVRTAEFVKASHVSDVNLLPLHHLGESKYRQLGLKYPCAEVPPPPSARLEEVRRIFLGFGLNCYLGHQTPF